MTSTSIWWFLRYELIILVSVWNYVILWFGSLGNQQYSIACSGFANTVVVDVIMNMKVSLNKDIFFMVKI